MPKNEKDDPMINFWKAWTDADELDKADLCMVLVNNFLSPELKESEIGIWKKHIASLLNSYFMDLEEFIRWRSEKK